MTPEPTDRSGGPIGPLKTPPPSWGPPIYGQDDILVLAHFGRASTSGGITVKATSLGILDAAPNPNCPAPGSGDVRAYSVTFNWSGFKLDFPLPGDGKRGQDSGWCFSPGEIVSGTAYTLWLRRPVGDVALDLYFFPNGASPARVFRFR